MFILTRIIFFFKVYKSITYKYNYKFVSWNYNTITRRIFVVVVLFYLNNLQVLPLCSSFSYAKHDGFSFFDTSDMLNVTSDIINIMMNNCIIISIITSVLLTNSSSSPSCLKQQMQLSFLSQEQHHYWLSMWLAGASRSNIKAMVPQLAFK